MVWKTKACQPLRRQAAPFAGMSATDHGFTLTGSQGHVTVEGLTDPRTVCFRCFETGIKDLRVGDTIHLKREKT